MKHIDIEGVHPRQTRVTLFPHNCNIVSKILQYLRGKHRWLSSISFWSSSRLTSESIFQILNLFQAFFTFRMLCALYKILFA